jgi:isoleucyl-tRNA synthetase
LDALIKWFAPILSFTTEEIYKLVFKKKSIHLEKFNIFPETFKNDNLELKWQELIKFRDICNLSIEEKRKNKIIGSSLEAVLKIEMSKKNLAIAKDIDFAELCITSAAHVIENEKVSISVLTEKAEGTKCPVCWKISPKPCLRHSN